MSKPYKDFEPKWFTERAPQKSYRSIFKWGDPDAFKVPKENLYRMMKSKFHMTDDDFQGYRSDLGLDDVHLGPEQKSRLTEDQLSKLASIVGKDNVSTDDYDRLSVAYGKTMWDLMRLREKKIDSLPDAVVYPAETAEVRRIVDFCYEENIPLYVYGGGSSVTRGVEPILGGISLDMRRRFNKVLSFNEVNHTITVQAGMSGPDLEHHLRNAAAEFGAKCAYTCGHFPQSFEYSSVGGWVVTRGAGQNSTYYGKIEDLVLGQKYETPIGEFVSDSYARKATGPSIDQIFMGGEGTFGVLCEVTLKFFFYRPQNHLYFSYMFPTWDAAMAAAREIMQGEFGFPSVFRLSDAEETDVMMKLYGIEGTPIDSMLRLKGMRSMERCLFLGFTDGELSFCRNIRSKAGRICRRHGAMALTGFPAKAWEKGRFSDPYLRDSMEDFGIVTDTLECTVNWDNMESVHQSVRAFCKSRPDTICMTHMSHAYPQGANLYWIFITRSDSFKDFEAYHRGILDAIQASGAAISHHHGIGKLFAPWLEGCIGTNQLELIRTIRDHLDPKHLMNPGGTIGLDLPEDQKRFIRPKW
jgi:alkyldihydroxyacetonephosphate synthase